MTEVHICLSTFRVSVVWLSSFTNRRIRSSSKLARS